MTSDAIEIVPGGTLVVPAFGDCTRGVPIAREVGDRVLAIADVRLFEIPPSRAG